MFWKKYFAQSSKDVLDVGGYCPICEKNTRFVASDPWLRDHLLCSSCGSIPRERALMHVISSCLPNWRTLDIHESSPVARGTSVKLAREAPGYLSSQYDPNVPRGAIDSVRGFRCEDLAAQTFPDESFDLVVTQDVFEHLPDPGCSIAEIARTLRPGGFHIASVPIVRKWEASRRRVSFAQDGTLTHHYPAEYHGNPVDEKGSLVTVDWGYDIGAFLTQNSGMPTVLFHINDINMGIRAEYIEIVVSHKSDKADTVPRII